MKPAKQNDTTRLTHVFKAAVPETDREHFLLSYSDGRTSKIEELNRYEAGELLDSLLKTVKMATAAQIQKLQCLYRDLNLTEQKKELLTTFTNGRTDSTAGLTMDEARHLIQELAQHEPTERMRKMIFSFAYRAGIIYGYSETDRMINKAKLNIFLREKGAVKKDLEKQKADELKHTLAQMAAMVRNIGRAADNKEAKQLTDELLNELNISKQ